MTVQTGANAYATARETQRKVFQNPRGLKYRYALLFKNSIGYDLIVRKSADGITWVDNDTLVMKDFGSNIYDGASWWFWEDSTNNQLCIYVSYTSSTGLCFFRKCTIADNSSAMIFGTEVQLTPDTNYTMYNPVILKDRLNYVWIIYMAKYVKAKTIYYDTACQISSDEGVNWSGQQIIHTHAYVGDSPEYATSYTFKSGATRQVYCLYKYLEATGTFTVAEGVELDWNGSALSPYNVKPINTTDWAMALDYKMSIVIDSNNKVIVILCKTAEQYLKCFSITIGADWVEEQDVDYYGTYGFGTLALSIDLTSSPNVLYAFYQINRPAPVQRDNVVRYKTSSSTTISWSTETAISDDTIKVGYFSSCQWNSNGTGVRIQLLYTVSTAVRFYEYSVSAPIGIQTLGDSLSWVVS